MVSLILVFFAAICNAIMDNLNFHYYKSIFKKWGKQNFWNPAVSWENKYEKNIIFKIKIPLPDPISDAWHICKSLMIIFLCFAIAFHKTILWFPIIDVAAAGLIWNFTFNIFFNHLLNEKN